MAPLRRGRCRMTETGQCQAKMSHLRQLQGSFRLFPLGGQGPRQLVLRALRQNHLACVQRGLANGVPVRSLNVGPHPPFLLTQRKRCLPRMSMRACESAARTDSAGVPIPGMVRDGGETDLGLSPRLNMPLDVGEVVGTQFVQQHQDELVDRAMDH